MSIIKSESMPEFLELITETDKMITYRDEEIKTTWKISLSAKRFYRKADYLYATQDIKYNDEFSVDEAKNLLFLKAEKHRKRLIKAGGWSIPAGSCAHPATFISLSGDREHEYLPMGQHIKRK